MLKTTPVRSALRKELLRYRANEVTTREVRRCILDHIKSGLRAELRPREWRDFKAEYSYVIDLYDDHAGPPKATFGRARDYLARMFAGNYRISEAHVKRSVERLLQWL